MAHVITDIGVDLGQITDKAALTYYKREPGYTIDGVVVPPLGTHYGTGPSTPAWQALTVYTTGQLAADPSTGVLIRRTAAGTSRASFDSTEQALWTEADILTPAQLAANTAFTATYVAVVTGLDLTGVTAGTATIQAALAAAPAGGKVILPAGTVKTNDLTIPADVTLDARRTTLLAGTITTAVVTLSDRSRFVGYRADMTGTTSAIAVDWGASTDATASNVRVVNGTTPRALRWNGCTRPTASYCSSTGAQYGILAHGSGATDGLMLGGSHTGGGDTTAGTGHMYVLNSTRCRFEGVQQSGATGIGWFVGGGTADCTFVACEGNTNGTTSGDWHGWHLGDTATRNRFIGCTSNSNTEAGYYANSTGTGNKWIACTANGNNTGHQAGGHGFEIDSPLSELVGCIGTNQGGTLAGSGCGAYLGSSVTVTGGLFDGNFGDGVKADSASDPQILAPTCTNNGGYGVSITANVTTYRYVPGHVTGNTSGPVSIAATGDGAAASRSPLGINFPHTAAFGGGSNVNVGFGANQGFYCRALAGGRITAIRIQVGTQSGNVCVAVYANTGHGVNARPGARKATSGSVACPATGPQDIALTAAVDVEAGDWLFFAPDNAVAQIAGNATTSVSTLGSGITHYENSAFPAPATATPAGALFNSLFLIGV